MLPSFASMRELNWPPSRKSTLARGVCQSGEAAFHCSMARGSLQAAHTRSMGALTVVSMVMFIVRCPTIHYLINSCSRLSRKRWRLIWLEKTPYLCATFTIHGVPKRSVTMPKPSDQKVFSNGMATWPPSASALKTRCPSAVSATPIDTHRPCGLT